MLYQKKSNSSKILPTQTAPFCIYVYHFHIVSTILSKDKFVSQHNWMFSVFCITFAKKDALKIALPKTSPTWRICLLWLWFLILKSSSVTLLLNVKKQTNRGPIFRDLPQKCMQLLKLGIRWVPQHPLMLPHGNKNISPMKVFCRSGSYSFHFHSLKHYHTMGDDPSYPKLTSQSENHALNWLGSQMHHGVRFSHFAKTLHNNTCDILLVNVSLRSLKISFRIN